MQIKSIESFKELDEVIFSISQKKKPLKRGVFGSRKIVDSKGGKQTTSINDVIRQMRVISSKNMKILSDDDKRNIDNIFNNLKTIDQSVKQSRTQKLWHALKGGDLKAKFFDLKTAVKTREKFEAALDKGAEKEFKKKLDQWKKIPSIQGEKIEAAKRILTVFTKKEKVLDLSDLKLTELPSFIGNLHSLETLHLENNHLSSLPPEIGNFNSLKVLIVSQNNLASLPPEIGRLKSLKVLDLDHNQIESLPTTIENLLSLERLRLSENKLHQIPHEIGQLKKLEMLDVSYNQLFSLPHRLGNLGELRELHVQANKLTSLPSTISNLHNLRYLNVSINNELKEFPKQIRDLRKLTDVYTEETEIPEAITSNIIKTNQKRQAKLPIDQR